jgi:hypothetical protein
MNIGETAVPGSLLKHPGTEDRKKKRKRNYWPFGRLTPAGILQNKNKNGWLVVPSFIITAGKPLKINAGGGSKQLDF